MKMSANHYIVFLLFCCVHGCEKPVVNTKLGAIRGIKVEDGNYSMYLGIPYADIDENKPFGDSTPHPPFKTVFDATDDSSKCPQQNEFTKKTEGDFGCLRLNIYVPNVKRAEPNNKLSVLVWIHGGGFVQGDGSRYLYGPKFFVRHNIILVTMNYRVGPYGLICLDVPEIPGNQAFKDQVKAFRWLKNHIESFGGDANRITVMGESSGAIVIQSYLQTDNEKLFDAAIIQSGSIYEPWGVYTVETETEKAIKICERLGFKSKDTKEIARFLSHSDPKEVVTASFDLDYHYGLCPERRFENVTPYLTEHPQALPVVNRNKLIPILGGYNSREQLVYYTDQNRLVQTPKFFYNCLSNLFHVDDEMVDIMHKYYIGDEEISPAVKHGLIDFISDCWHNYPVQRYLVKQMNVGAKVYQYLFSYSGTRNFVKKRFNITDVGASHADELGYLFDISYEKETAPDDQLIIDRITTLWANFVKYWDPTPETTELLPVKWIPITEKKLNYMNIDLELSMKTRPFHSRLAFWDLYYKAYEKNIVGLENK